MKMVTNYFLLEGKRSLFVLKKSIMSLVCVVFALVAVMIGVFQLLMQTPVFPKIEVGIVSDVDSQMLDFAMGYLTGMESVESVCNFRYVDYEQGESMLSEGELQVVVLLPASLYDELNNLEHSKATIMLSEKEDLGVRMFGELLGSAVNLLQVGEAGVAASYKVTAHEMMLFNRSDLGNFLALKYAFQALDRMDTYDDIVVSPMGLMSGVQFYYLTLLLCICLICGLNFSYLYEKKQKAMENKLRIEGVGYIQQSAVKIVLMGLYVFVVESAVYIAGCIVSQRLGLRFLEFNMGTVGILLLQAIAFGAHFHLIYSVAKDEKQGTLLLLISSILFVVCAGLIVPQIYLPEVAQWIGNLSPLFSWSMLGQQALFGEVTSITLAGVGIWFLAELGMGVYCSWKNA